MPQIIDYSVVSETLLGAGFESLYHNSGAFGFPRAVPTHSVGWIGADDPTLREAARPLTRRVAAPYEATLAALATRAWRDILPGPLWLMPKSHWAYELDFGSREWLAGTLERIGIDPRALEGRNDGSAIEHGEADAASFASMLEDLLTRLRGSDFAFVVPGRPVVCTVHHHAQLWWTTTDAAVVRALDAMVPPGVLG